MTGIGGVKKLEEFEEFAAAMAVSDESVDLSSERINSGQQAERAMTFVLMISREGRMDVGAGGKSGAVVAMAWIPGFSS